MNKKQIMSIKLSYLPGPLEKKIEHWLFTQETQAENQARTNNMDKISENARRKQIQLIKKQVLP